MNQNHQSFDVNSTGAICAAVILGTIGVLSFIVQPGLAYGFVTSFGIGEDKANQLLGMEGFGIASGAVLAAVASRFVNWRILTAMLLVAAAAGNAFSATLDRPDLNFVLARFVTGLGEGGIITLSFAMISLTQRIERNLAIYLTLLLTYGALGLWASPIALSLIGLQGVFWIWAAVTLVSLILVRFIPPRAGARTEPSPSAAYVGPVMLACAVIAVLLYNTGIGVAWANLFFVGLEITPDENAVAEALLASQFVAILGALVAIGCERWMGRWLPVVSGIAVGSAALAFLLGKPAYAIFFISVCVFNFTWNFFLPFMLSAVEDMRKGEMMTITIAAQMIGLTVAGPFLAAEILKADGSLQTAILCAVVLLILSLCLLVPAKLKHKNTLAHQKINEMKA